MDVLSRVISDTSLLTVTEQLAYLPLPSFAVDLTVAVPLETAVTLPLSSTVATEVLLDVHVKDLSAAFDGDIVVVRF